MHPPDFCRLFPPLKHRKDARSCVSPLAPPSLSPPWWPSPRATGPRPRPPPRPRPTLCGRKARRFRPSRSADWPSRAKACASSTPRAPRAPCPSRRPRPR
ncbi:MAG: hypothetical protein B7Y86_15185 [Brevundimonas subvibrioides]|uniref:Uncharacterized protein n=1 Tax=Brevundimonas subvibrioides TaxID=74313 RepID=A0A258HD01_9CAUL|nr:MAG: hypothetical protein B7Y86_15185 [Brevundimonas subvibrioides]